MNEDTFNMDIRKFLKKVGINAQREIEHAVLRALDYKKLNGTETLKVSMTLDVPELAIQHKLDDQIHLK
jgi:ribosomal protein L1